MRAVIIAFAILISTLLSNFAFAGEAEIAAGRQVFNNCIACHSLEPGKLGFGPDLHGVVGRAAASIPTFDYSPALKKSKLVWTEDNLRAWISGNDKKVPGTRMRHVSITDRAEQDYLIAFLSSLEGAPRDHAMDAELLLSNAVDKLTTDGAKTAFAAFNKHGGDFVNGEVYVFVFDLKGKYMASGANPKLTGTDAHDLQDREGTYIVREMIDIAKSSGSGAVDYVWLNRNDNKVENKRSIIQKVGKYIVGVGYYLN
jgi:cytochrome c